MARVDTGRIVVGSFPSNKLGKHSFDIVFKTPFAADQPLPIVHLLLSGLDAQNDANTRIRASVESITRTGFQFKTSTWADTTIWQAQFSWIATNLVEDSRNGVVEFESMNKNGSRSSLEKRIRFNNPLPEGIDASSIPISVSLTLVDVDREHFCRIGLDVKDVSRKGFTLVATTWEDTIIHAIHASWFCSISDSFRFDSVWRASYGDEPRFDVKRRDVLFEHTSTLSWPCSHSAPRAAVVGVTALDTDSGHNMRFSSTIDGDGPTATQCKARLATWSDSLIYGARISIITCKDCTGATDDFFAPLVELPPDLELPPDYEFVSTIPVRGYFGQCYRGRNIHDGHLYCIKHFTQDRSQFADEISKELRNLAALPLHPNIVRYHHCSVHRGQLFIIMELIHGCCLDKLLPSAEKPLRPSLLMELFRQIFDGFAHLHASKIIHRDVHMGNILVSFKPHSSVEIDTRCDSAKVIDFGWAKQQETREAATQSVGARFTMCYHSPERLLPGSMFNEKDDVWALGCMMTELLTGKLIRDREQHNGDLFATLEHRERVELVIEDAIGAHYGLGNLAASILRARTPAERPSAAELRDVLAAMTMTMLPIIAASSEDEEMFRVGSATAVALFFNGTFAPCHRGHIDTIVASVLHFHRKRGLVGPLPSSRLDVVVGVYLSPSHQDYCVRKNGHMAMPKTERVEMLKLLCVEAMERLRSQGCDVPVMIDMEEIDANPMMPYPEMIRLFHRRAREGLGKKHKRWPYFNVIRLAGSDVANPPGFPRDFGDAPDSFSLAVVDRPDAHANASKQGGGGRGVSNIHYISCPNLAKPLSSTNIRNAFREFEACREQLEQRLIEVVDCPRLAAYLFEHPLASC